MAATTHVADAMQAPAPGAPAASATVSPSALRQPWPRRILVASGGCPSAEPALVIARALARRSGSAVELLAVFAPRIPLPGGATPARCEAPDRLQAADLLRRVRAQRDAIVRSGRAWPVRFESGDPRHVIVRVAHERAADLVVVGIGRADPRQRREGDITAAVLAHHLDVPVYAAMPGVEDLPSRVIVLLPEGRIHAPTLHAAVRCGAPRAEILVVRPTVPAVQQTSNHRPHAEVEAESLALGGAESLVADVGVRCVELDGDIVPAAIAFAATCHADLIVLPMRGRSPSVRALLHHHAPPLLLAATCSVLVVPDSPAEGGAAC